MPEVIKVPTALYTRLAKHARGFDTPANVIEMLLNYYEGVDADDAPEDSRSSAADTPSAPSSRRYEKYLFENREYGKGRLVLAVVTAHAKSNPHMTYSDLLATFPKRLQGSSRGVFDTKEMADEIFNREGRKRHFISPDELITLEDAVIAVSTQWGVNTDNFIQHARALGYVITSKAEAG